MKEENKKQEIEVEEGNDAFSDSQSVSNETEYWNDNNAFVCVLNHGS